MGEKYLGKSIFKKYPHFCQDSFMEIISYISSMQDAILKTMSRTTLAATQLGKQSKVKHTSIYCAFLRKAPQMRSDMDHTVLLSRPGWLVTYRNKVPPPGVEPGHGHLSQY